MGIYLAFVGIFNIFEQVRHISCSVEFSLAWKQFYNPGLQIRVRNKKLIFLFLNLHNKKLIFLFLNLRNNKLFFLFLNQNICCGYSKKPS